MIAVDTSVWISHLRNVPTQEVLLLRSLITARQQHRIVVGDLVLAEILQGLSTEQQAKRVESALRIFSIQSMVGEEIAIKAAANYRALRAEGITVRRTIDMLIGTFCIERRMSLLHADRDYDHMERLGLKVLRA